MQITLKKQLKSAVLEIIIDEKDEKEALAKALFYAKPDYCGLCKKNNIIWDSNRTKDDFLYIKKVCLDCKATSTAGSFKSGGLFWKNWEIYQPKSKKNDDGFSGDIDLTLEAIK